MQRPEVVRSSDSCSSFVDIAESLIGDVEHFTDVKFKNWVLENRSAFTRLVSALIIALVGAVLLALSIFGIICVAIFFSSAEGFVIATTLGVLSLVVLLVAWNLLPAVESFRMTTQKVRETGDQSWLTRSELRERRALNTLHARISGIFRTGKKAFGTIVASKLPHIAIGGFLIGLLGSGRYDSIRGMDARESESAAGGKSKPSMNRPANNPSRRSLFERSKAQIIDSFFDLGKTVVIPAVLARLLEENRSA